MLQHPVRTTQTPDVQLRAVIAMSLGLVQNTAAERNLAPTSSRSALALVEQVTVSTATIQAELYLMPALQDQVERHPSTALHSPIGLSPKLVAAILPERSHAMAGSNLKLLCPKQAM